MKRRDRERRATEDRVANAPLGDPNERSTLPDRAGVILGGAMGVLLLILLAHPNRAEPGRHLLFYFGLLGLGAVMLLQSFALRPAVAVRGVLNLGFGCAVLYGLWWFGRWRAMETRPWVGAQGVATALALLPAIVGAAGAVMTPVDSGRPLAARTLRWTLFLSIFAFGLHALYQRFIGYDIQLRQLREALAGRESMSPLMAQSMIHALEEKRVGGPFGNGNLLAACVATLTAFVPPVFFEARRPGGGGWIARAIAAAALGLGLVTVVLTGSRGGALSWMAAVALGSLAAWGANGTSKRAGGGAAPTAAALLLAVAFGLAARGANAESLIERIGKTDTIRERFYYWGIAGKLVAMNPMAGEGPGAFELNYPALKPPKARESRYAHSWAMHIAAESGVVGLALFLGVAGGASAAVAGAWAGTRRRSYSAGPGEEMSEPGREILYFGAAAATLLFNGLFEYSMQTREFTMLFGGLAGSAIGLGAARRGADHENISGPRRGAILILVGLALVNVVIGTWLVVKLQMAAVWEWRGRVSAQVGEHAQAAEDFGRAIAWTPRNDAYQSARALALLSADRANAPESLRGLAEAESLNPTSSQIQQDFARIYMTTGDPAKAAYHLDNAVERNPNDSGVRLHRANVNVGLKRMDAVREDILYIRDAELPLWEYEEPEYERLKTAAGLE